MSTGQLPLGVIVGPQGIKGQFKVKSFAESPQSLSAYGPVTMDNGQQLKLHVISVNTKGLAIARAKGVETREAAEALRGLTLYVSRDSLPDLDDGEFYHADLLGVTIVEKNGGRLGKIVAIHDFGAGEIAELAPESGPTIMIPFGGDRLLAVDMVAKEICLLVPPGLLDDAGVNDQACPPTEIG